MCVRVFKRFKKKKKMETLNEAVSCLERDNLWACCLSFNNDDDDDDGDTDDNNDNDGDDGDNL